MGELNNYISQYVIEFINEVLNGNVDYIAIVLSIISLIFAFIGCLKNKRDFRLANAPLFLVENETLEINKKRWFEDKYAPKLPHRKFIFDQRSFEETIVGHAKGFLQKNAPKEIDVAKTYTSIILDLTEDDDYERAERKIGYCKLNMRNVGFPFIVFKIRSISIQYKNGNILTLRPWKHDTLTRYIKKNETLDIVVSVFYDKSGRYAFFDENKVEDMDFMEQKLLATQGKITNTYLPDDANNFDKITINSVTKNIYNYRYKQRIELIQENGVVYTKTYLVRWFLVWKLHDVIKRRFNNMKRRK